ncbi:hypothetical protein FA95DRAFT_1300634 [Auriscalpium vulgare]|uniref:Uncharacterized protein n=1 Tax=Auriscalpium vulgare TaxID=40419 RepID=A0ACB8RSQ5_9AGAM|nr:hypothetical protein FA95DRAFT_1300634 [Auriscalpium vulgare]
MADLDSAANASTHPGKRARTESDAFIVVKSQDLWFPKGDIIIRTTSEAAVIPRTRMMYKVHKDILALHCTAFADIFGGPQAAFEGVSEQDEGAPVMDLPDAEEDVSAFLKALYFPTETKLHPGVLNPYLGGEKWNLIPSSYHGTLRLATKYDAAGIRRLIIEALLQEWPTVLGQWDRLRQALANTLPLVPEENHWSCYPSSGNMIRLAMDCNVPDALPSAFYDLSCAVEDERDDGLSLLTSKELCTFTTGQRALYTRFSNMCRDFSNGACRSETCSAQGKSDCADVMGELWQTVAAFQTVASRPSDPLAWIGFLPQCVDASGAALCSQCQRWSKSEFIKMRKALWKELPGFFSLANSVTTSWGYECEDRGLYYP